LRRYLAALDLTPPVQQQISVYPAPDYWRLTCEAAGVDYALFRQWTE
jgi:hypothetical protein